MIATIYRFINKECISFGFTINWNYHFEIEIDFLFWRINYMFWKKRFNQKRRKNNG